MAYSASSIPIFSAVRRQPVARRSLLLRRRYIRQIILLLAVVMGFLLLLIWTRIKVIQLGYEVSKIRKGVADLVEQKHLLEAEVASLKSTERIEKIAHKHFGMRFPQGDEIVFVK